MRKEARKLLDYHTKMLKAHEKIWQEKWESAKNPFLAWMQYKKDAKIRLLILSPWIAARDFYDSLPKPREEEALNLHQIDIPPVDQHLTDLSPVAISLACLDIHSLVEGQGRQ